MDYVDECVKLSRLNGMILLVYVAGACICYHDERDRDTSFLHS